MFKYTCLLFFCVCVLDIAISFLKQAEVISVDILVFKTRQLEELVKDQVKVLIQSLNKIYYYSYFKPVLIT